MHEVKQSPQKVQIALQLFFQSTIDAARYLGLSIIREYLSSSPITLQDTENRYLIRTTASQWLEKVLADGNIGSSPSYVVNNMLSIFTLCIKREYPEHWPTAFEELLSLGDRYGLSGLDMVVRVLNELEIEVVMFQERRSAEEMAHNAIIKDTMRETNMVQRIVRFLVQAITFIHTNLQQQQQQPQEQKQFVSLGLRCLGSLSELIGWIDINIVISEALGTLYTLLVDNDPLEIGALTCIYEIVKKGMDPVAKSELINGISLIPKLVNLSPRFVGTVAMYQTDSKYEQIFVVHRQIGLVVDMIVLELLGCWIKYEDYIASLKNVPLDESTSGSMKDSTAATPTPDTVRVSTTEELVNIAPFVSQMIKLSLPEMINLLYHPAVTVANAVLPSSNKLLQLLKLQKSRAIPDKQIFVDQNYFVAKEFLDAFMVAAFRQTQYPESFAFDEAEDGEDEQEQIEVTMPRLIVEGGLYRVPFKKTNICREKRSSESFSPIFVVYFQREV